jgi:hypothetical protein
LVVCVSTALTGAVGGPTALVLVRRALGFWRGGGVSDGDARDGGLEATRTVGLCAGHYPFVLRYIAPLARRLAWPRGVVVSTKQRGDTNKVSH